MMQLGRRASAGSRVGMVISQALPPQTASTSPAPIALSSLPAWRGSLRLPRLSAGAMMLF
jgi:hypothetical protein